MKHSGAFSLKQSSTFTSFLVFLITVLLFTITSLLMTSCSGVRYTYFNKQKVPYTAAEETMSAKVIPAKPFLTQSENELKEKVSLARDKNSRQKNITENGIQKKAASPATLEQIFNEMNIAKYIPKAYQGIHSENDTHEDRTLLIVLLVVLILIVIALLGDELLWLLFLALLILLIYALVKYLGIFN